MPKHGLYVTISSPPLGVVLALLYIPTCRYLLKYRVKISMAGCIQSARSLAGCIHTTTTPQPAVIHWLVPIFSLFFAQARSCPSSRAQSTSYHHMVDSAGAWGSIFRPATPRTACCRSSPNELLRWSYQFGLVAPLGGRHHWEALPSLLLFTLQNP